MKETQDIDWARVRRLARASFTGKDLEDKDFAYLQLAWKADSARYRSETESVRDDERAKMRMQ